MAVRCNRIIHYRSKEPGSKQHPVLPGYTNINATSGNLRWKGLSPMKLGPFTYKEKKVPLPWYPDGIHPGFTDAGDDEQTILCQNFENLWQGSKVYPRDLGPDGLVQPSFYERRKKMVFDPQPHRRALPKKEGLPHCAYWNGHLWNYLDSRVMYCTLYAGLVQNTPEYQELRALVTGGTNVQILGYDGQDLPITSDSMAAAYKDPTKPFGHELVLCCLLTGLSPWSV